MFASPQQLRPNEREIRFGTKAPAFGLVLLLVGAGFLYLAWHMTPASFGNRIFRVRSGGLGFLVVLLGMALTLVRNELILDLQSRMFTRRQGVWPNLRTTTGSMDQIEALTLRLDTRKNQYGKPYNVWVVQLSFKGDMNGEGNPGARPRRPRILGSYRSESRAYSQFESLARTLEVPALDRTGAVEKVVSPGRDGSAIPAPWQGSKRGVTVESIPPLPPQSRILLLGLAPSRTILLHRRGVNGSSVGLAVCGLLSCWMGGVVLQAMLTEPPVPKNSPLNGPIFILIGLLFLFVAVWIAVAREVAEENGLQVQFGRRAFGIFLGMKWAGKDEIEEIALKPKPLPRGRASPASRAVAEGREAAISGVNQVFIRSSRAIVRLGDGLAPEELQWLLQGVQAICVRS